MSDVASNFIAILIYALFGWVIGHAASNVTTKGAQYEAIERIQSSTETTLSPSLGQ